MCSTRAASVSGGVGRTGNAWAGVGVFGMMVERFSAVEGPAAHPLLLHTAVQGRPGRPGESHKSCKGGGGIGGSAVSYAPNLSRTPVRRAVLPHSSARHGPAHVAHVCASLMSRSLGLVGRREPSAMTAIRARDPDGWPTFRVDEERFFWTVRQFLSYFYGSS